MKFEAPIPGENLVSDGKNYPWRRPPEIVDFDQGVSYLINKMDEEEEVEVIFALMGIGATVVTITSIMLLTAVSQGRISIDLAVLAAGPISRYIEIKAKAAGVKHELGLEDPDRKPLTPTGLKMMLGLMDEEDDEEAPVEEPTAPEEAPVEDSLMARPEVAATDEQAEMLGNLPEDEEEEVV